MPVAVELTPYFSSFGELALRLGGLGADGLVLFNRFLQPQVDVQTLTVSPVIGLFHSSDARLPQDAWIALLREQLTISLPEAVLRPLTTWPPTCSQVQTSWSRVCLPAAWPSDRHGASR